MAAAVLSLRLAGLTRIRPIRIGPGFDSRCCARATRRAPRSIARCSRSRSRWSCRVCISSEPRATTDRCVRVGGRG